MVSRVSGKRGLARRGITVPAPPTLPRVASSPGEANRGSLDFPRFSPFNPSGGPSICTIGSLPISQETKVFILVRFPTSVGTTRKVKIGILKPSPYADSASLPWIAQITVFYF